MKTSSNYKRFLTLGVVFIFFLGFASLSQEDIQRFHDYKERLFHKSIPPVPAEGVPGSTFVKKKDSAVSSGNTAAGYGMGSIPNNSPSTGVEGGEAHIPGGAVQPQVFVSGNREGAIGTLSDEDTDKVSDNFFSFDLQGISASSEARAYLAYELYGLSSHLSVPRSINGNVSTGGSVVLPSAAWSSQKEEVNISQLRRDANTVMFSSPGAGIKYRVRNVRIVIEPAGRPDNISISSALSDDKLYIKGFLEGTYELKVNSVPVAAVGGEFESVIRLSPKERNSGSFTVWNGSSSQKFKIPESRDAYSISSENFPQLYTRPVTSGESFSAGLDGFKVEAPDTDTKVSGTASFLKLRDKDLPPMSGGMKNTTLGGGGFRIHGDAVPENVRITMPYDAKRLGQNRSQKEIKVFYFDYAAREWRQVGSKVSVDEKERVVAFSGKGGTDYINGVISTPESPQVNAFAPTGISGLKAADPTSKIPMMAPPSANQKGDARISYPIIIPSGRNGMQPSLTVSYSSSSGNGWLGEGWDIAGLSSISLDTRWGSPRFDPGLETELYSLDGNMLVYDGNYLPHRHNDLNENTTVYTTEKQKRIDYLNNKKVFYLRRSHDFTKIERYGATPKEYRWVLTSTRGDKSYYGGDENSVNQQSVIKTAEGNIANWALWKTVDTYGNNVIYKYDNSTVSGLGGDNSNLNGGSFFHIQSILYTGKDGGEGNYSVDFDREASITRPDISINAKSGMKRVEPYMLNSVSVKYNGTLIRRYGFSFRQGEFYKTLLDKILEYDKDGIQVNRYDLEYYDDLKNGGPVINYSSGQNIAAPATDAFPILPPSLYPSKINSTYSYEWGLHFRAPSIGVSILWPTQNPYGHAQVSFNIGKSNADAKKAQQLIDFDGDGVQDIIFRKPNSGLYIMSGNLTNNVLNFGYPKKILNLNSNFSQTSTATDQIGFDAGMKVFGIGLNYSQIWSTSKSETPVFITDSNSDGLMDVVKDGEVWFNKKNSNETPEMTKFSDQTENMVVVADAVTEHNVPLEGWHTISNNDVVKIWVAPKSGYIKFTDMVSIENLPNAKAVYSVEIKNPFSANSKNGRIYLKVLTPSVGTQNITINNYNDYFGSIQSLPPTDPNSHWGINNSQKLYVHSGDKVFIRLHKRENTNFKALSNPKIIFVNEFGQEIQNNEEEEQSGFYLNNGSYSDNFVLNNNSKPLIFNEEGSLNISVPAVNFSNSNDKIVFKIIKVNLNTSVETELYNSDNYGLYPQTSGAFTTNPVTLNNIAISSADLPAAIRFVAETDSHTKFKNNNWNNTDVVFTPSVGPVKSYKGIAGYDSYYITDFGKKINIKETTGTLPPGVQNYGVQINKAFPTNPTGLNPGTFYYIVKKGGLVLAKRRVIVAVNNGVQISELDLETSQTINGISPIPIYNMDLQNSSIPVDQRINIQVYGQTKSNIDLYRDYSGLFSGQPFNIYYGPDNTILSSIHETSINSGGMAHIAEFYNNWGQFLYNDAADVVAVAIKDDPDGFQYNPNTPADYYGRLINLDKITDFEQPSNFNFSQCNSIPTNTPNYSDVYAQCVADQINNSNVYGGANMIPQPVTPLNAIKVGTVEKWVGIGPEQYSMAGSFKDDETVSDFYTPPTTDPGMPDAVVQGNVDTKMYSISKKHYSKSRTRTLSGSLFSASIGNSHSELVGMGSVDLQDFMDLNGDGYPDIVYKDANQLTLSTGGLGALQGAYTNTWLSQTDSYQNSISAQFSPDTFKSVGAAFRHGFATTLRANSDNSSPWSSGLSGNYDSKDINQSFWLDINGDGLPDNVIGGGTSNMKYRLNLGYSLGAAENFTNLATIASHPVGTAGVSFNTSIIQSLSNFPISAGVSASASLGSSDTTLEDINGDGLLDVLNISSNSTQVLYNLGNKFSPPVTLYKESQIGIDFNNEAKTYNGGAFVEAHWYKNKPIWWIIIPFVWIPIPILYLKVGGQTTGQVGISISEVDKAFKDMNGDGFPDLVVSKKDGFTVNYSTIGRTNKLKRVTNILDYGRKVEAPMSQFTLDYENKTPTYSDPHARLVLKEVQITNPDVNSGSYIVSSPDKNKIFQFQYSNSVFDRRERDYFGFEVVTSKEMDGNSIFRSSRETFYNKGYFLNGLLRKSEAFSASGTLLSSTSNTYRLYKFKNNNTQIDLGAALPEDYDIGGTKGRKMAVALLAGNKKTDVENGGNIEVNTTMVYSDKGLLTNYLYQSPSSTYNTKISYWALNNNIISVPKSVDTYEGTAQTSPIRHRETVADANTGGIVRTSTRLNASEVASTDILYDAFGSISKILYPANLNGERYELSYTYDAATHKYATSVTDAFGLSSSSQYDPLFDVPQTVADAAGNHMEYTYDSRGRLVKILAPKEQGVSEYTVRYAYNTSRFANPVGAAERYLYMATTDNYDPQHPDNPIQTISFADGYGKVVQTKKDIDVDGTERMMVSGRTFYDKFGRPVQQFQSIAEDKDPNIYTNETINFNLSPYFSTAKYDDKDRATSATDEDGHTVNSAYTVESGMYKTTVTMLQNQTTQLKSEKYTNAEGRVSQSKSYLAAQALTTTFVYNAIGELVRTTDPEDIGTEYSYDLAGRRIHVLHPDRGISHYTYDAAGNLVKSQTQNLEDGIYGSPAYIVYGYSYNRLREVRLPDVGGAANPDNSLYDYGAPVTGNNAGRLVHKIDGSGEAFFQYGSMGELVKETRTIYGPNIQPMTFTTKYEYDSWNRPLKTTYPDSEAVSYQYNLGGDLRAIRAGKKAVYLADTSYDEKGRKTKEVYGNGAVEEYAYLPTNGNLSLHKLTDNAGHLLLDNRYTYDYADNITGVTNTAAQSPNEMGGSYMFAYAYDQLNRLAGSSGIFGIQRKEGPPVLQQSPYQVSNSQFDLRMDYNPAGGIAAKRQNHSQDGSPVQANSYDNDYKYIGGTHMLEHIDGTNGGEDFKYDADGNMVYHRTEEADERLFWDERDRLKAFYDRQAGAFQYYAYDDAGERAIKYTLREPAQLYQNGTLVDAGGMALVDYKLYPNAYTVVSSDGFYTKHYYAGSRRIATRLKKGAEIFIPNPGPRKQAEQNSLEAYLKKAGIDAAKLEAELERGQEGREDVYWLHGDQLGTANYVTTKAETTQFFLNLPFGETMAEQMTGAYGNPYKFNAKELDDETGLYYYGARYYNPRISIWYGVDPLAEKMLGWSPYAYAFDNPINFVDPDGREPFDWVRRKDGSIYWDNKANDQATTKAGETYMGKSLRIGMDSYIDKKLWDGPNPWFDVSGSKLQSDIWISSQENSKGELTGISATIKSEIMTNKGGFKGVKIDSMPDIESSKSFVDTNGKFIGFNITVEKHAQVPEIEKLGLVAQGYGPVNVAQRIDVNYIGKDLNISFKTDVFPSASAGIIGKGGPFKLMQYDQPSYKKTHNLKDNGIRKPYLYPRN